VTDLLPATWSQLFVQRIDADGPAVLSSCGVWSCRDLARRAAGAADWLDSLGASSGRPVAALVTGTADVFALAVGATGSNRPLAPLGPRHATAELIACLQPLAPSLVVAEAPFEEAARAAADPLGMEVQVIPVFEPSERPLDLDPAPDDVAIILHTSGTSGLPKRVPYRQDRLARRTQLNASLLDLGPGSVYASASPFQHIAGAGMLYVAMGAGAALCPFPRFTADAWADVVERRVTHALLVPSMVEQLLDSGTLHPGALRFLQYGASPIHPDTLRRVMEALPGVELSQIYGQTEGSPITCLTTSDHRRIVGGDTHLLASQGRAVDTVELVIHEPDGTGIGEVWARAPHLFQPAADGWLHTGDLGRLDAEGYLFLTGRTGDMIIRGGENVHPEEVERVLVAHPAVKEVAVIGLADRRLGQLVAAFVVPADPGAPPADTDLRAYARAALAGYKVPERWIAIEELPRNAAGKVLRRELRP